MTNNISNLFVQTNVISSAKADLETVKTGESDFMDFMKSSTEDIMSIGKSAGNSESDGLGVAAPVKLDTAKNATSIKNVTEKAESKAENPVTEKVKSEVKAYDEKVTKAVAKELNVSEEDVKEAMTVLGLTTLDLNDKSNMAQLISQITGQDSISLVMDEGFTNLNNIVSKLFDELLDATGIEKNDFTAELFTEALEYVDQAQMTETANASVDMPEQKDVVISNADVPEAEAKDITDTKPENVFVKTADDEEKPEDTDTVKPDAVTTEAEVKTQSDTKQETDSKAKEDDSKATKDFGTAVNNSPVANAIGNEQPVFSEVSRQVTLPTGETVDTAKILEQIVEQVKTQVTPEKQSIEMILNPDGLGKVYMEVSKQNGEVVAKFFTENEAMKEALESQLMTLKESISNGETKITAVEVSVGAHEFEKNLEEGQQNEEKDREPQQQTGKGMRSLNLNNLDELQGLMTEEEALAAQIMKDNGNTVNMKA